MKKNKYLLLAILAILAISTCYASQALAAVSLDRTRIIFNSEQKSVSLTITNKNDQLPYLAQGWIENEQGKKVSTPFATLPPIQRLEPNKSSQLRIEALPEIKNLPQDRESLYYFNLREIPPKSDKPNVLQLALQSKIKLFYRPAAIELTNAEKINNPWQNKLILLKKENNYIIDNPTPFFITIVGATNSNGQRVSNEFESVMAQPFKTIPLGLTVDKLGNNPKLIYINDYGGRVELDFYCENNKCSTKK
ncbi:TPA: fimbria/pilus periplasmic chaperone [Proteus mirabilis]|nr:fimbria/pilus periplasmic chaperone [Proteus mirabilis]HEK2725504.1 fimbria/pilus periplasmic chaperone [Proteus mirabilis]HEK2725970.1 fimbria/pilus periplasmic chaperone [Proteus mirabilis]